MSSVPTLTLPPALPLDTTVPAIIAEAGEAPARRFLEFFTANIRNPNTRVAYHRAICDFLTWCEDFGLGLGDIQPLHVATYIEGLGHRYRAPTVKQRLAAIRMLFDWLVVGQVLPANPAAAVRGPRHSVAKGKTPVLSAEEARHLLDAIPTETLAGLRDRAFIGVLVYSFARIGAALAMRVEDYYPQEKRWWLRLHEKGGKQHEMPALHNLETYLDAYIQKAGLADDPEGPLFRTLSRGKGRPLSKTALPRENAYAMIKRRARAAGITTPLGCHSFRATGIIAYLEGGGTLENAQAMASHASTRTTQLYDRRQDQITLDEVERIGI